MNALDAVSARAQPGYEAGVEGVATSLRSLFGPACFEGLEAEQLAGTLAALLERRPAGGGDNSPSATVIRDLTVLEWCCGLSVDDAVKTRLARLLRRDYRLQFEAAGLKRPRPDVAARRSHMVFIGVLGSPLHSPSIAAVGYLRALADDPKNRCIEVYHHGPINPELDDYMRGFLPSSIVFHQIEQTPNYMAAAIARAPCTYHFWCFQRTSITSSFMAMYGPTVMFTCADDPPEQYADVYWACRPPEHIEGVWSAAPASFRANYVESTACIVPPVPPVKVRSKTDLGFAESDLLLATVGNRLGIDLDEAFVTGVEKVLRRRPNCRWLVIGKLPDWLSNPMRTVLGPQFLHMEFEPDLPGLMPAVDVWINPFRRGGGNSALIAANAGVPVLTRSDIGDVASIVPPDHWAKDAGDYFAKLDGLLDDPAPREAWSQAQRAFLDAKLDKALYSRELDRIVALAFERFRTRAGRRLDAIFPDTPLAAAA